MNRDKLILDVSSILNSEVGSSLKYKVNYRANDLEKDVKIIGKIKGDVLFNHLEENSLNAFVNLNLQLNLKCARCLEDFKKNINLTYEQRFSDKKEDDVFPIFADKTIDLFSSIRQEILIAIPTIPLCKQKCKGIKV